jgi:hypothetical protein
MRKIVAIEGHLTPSTMLKASAAITEENGVISNPLVPSSISLNELMSLATQRRVTLFQKSIHLQVGDPPIQMIVSVNKRNELSKLALDPHILAATALFQEDQKDFVHLMFDERKYLKSYIDKLVSSVIEAGLAKKLPFDFEQALKYVQLLDQNNVLLSSALVAIKLPKERQHEKERALANIDPSITPSDFDRYVDVFKALASNQEAVFDKKNASSTFLSTTFS